MIIAIYRSLMIIVILLCVLFVIGEREDKELRRIMAIVLIACILTMPFTLLF